MGDPSDRDDGALSRPTSSALGGKQTETLKTSVSVEVREDFERFARGRGYQSSSDCLRELVLVAMHGPDFLANLHRERIASLVLNSPGIGTAQP